MSLRDVAAYISFAISSIYLFNCLRSWIRTHKACLHELVDWIAGGNDEQEIVEEAEEESDEGNDVEENVEESSVEESNEESSVEENDEENDVEEAEEETFDEPGHVKLTPIEMAIKYIEKHEKIAKITNKNKRAIVELENGDVLTVKELAGPSPRGVTVTKEKKLLDDGVLVIKTFRDADGNPTAISVSSIEGGPLVNGLSYL